MGVQRGEKSGLVGIRKRGIFHLSLFNCHLSFEEVGFIFKWQMTDSSVTGTSLRKTAFE